MYQVPIPRHQIIPFQNIRASLGTGSVVPPNPSAITQVPRPPPPAAPYSPERLVIDPEIFRDMPNLEPMVQPPVTNSPKGKSTKRIHYEYPPRFQTASKTASTLVEETKPAPKLFANKDVQTEPDMDSVSFKKITELFQTMMTTYYAQCFGDNV
jgi:hypothetical protein